MRTYLVGDTFERVREIPDGSVSLVACSPPFIALRSYLPADHPDKHKAHADGDSQKGGNGWPRAKSLALIPQAYALSLAYGRNVLTGAESPTGRWLVRNEIVWHRPNPAVGALGDKVRPSTSYICVATRSPKRWFDLTAVRTPLKVPEAATLAGARMNRASIDHPGDARSNLGAGGTRTDRPMMSSAAGAPPLDCWFDQHDTWTITTQPSRLAHYAMWPPKLAERLILMMCPQWVCTVCGEPRRRVEGVAEYVQTRSGGTPTTMDMRDGRQVELGVVRNWSANGAAKGDNGVTRTAPTLGWTDCGHGGNYRPGVVLDPFCGTNTTGNVSELHGRDSIGIDIDARNEALMDARMDECRRALFGTMPELPGQLGFDGMAS